VPLHPGSVPSHAEASSPPAAAVAATLFELVVADTLDGERLRLCLQCGTCGGSCPSGPDMDHTPRALFARLAAGDDDAVLGSNTPWYCVSCYHCVVRCPQAIPITDFMYALRRRAARAGRAEPAAIDFSRLFVELVERYGRSFELGLATRYHLTHSPLSKIGQGPMALGMVRRDRLALRPRRIAGLQQLQAILARARALEGN
jgi:heterodisulfide reductase subunit C